MLRHVAQWKLTDVLRNAYCLHHHGATSQKTVVFNLARSLALIPVLDSLQMASMCPYPAETEGRTKQSRGCLCLGAYWLHPVAPCNSGSGSSTQTVSFQRHRPSVSHTHRGGKQSAIHRCRSVTHNRQAGASTKPPCPQMSTLQSKGQTPSWPRNESE
jgi:hypothetical protein